MAARLRRSGVAPGDLVRADDLAKALNHPKVGVAYAVCWVRSDWPRDILLRLGSNDGIKIWINRLPAFDHQVTRAARPGQDTARTHLAVGWNEVLVKVDNFGGPWGFYLELVDPATQQPVPRVEVRTAPPAGFKVKAAPPFLRDWQLLGPFACQPVQGHHQVFPPETDKLDLHKPYDGLRGKVRWRRYRSPGNYIDLAKIYNHHKAAVAYAVCWVRSDAARPVRLSIGSNDGVKVWVNRQLRFSHDIGRSAKPGQDKARTDLAAGWNELLVKVDNRDNNWGFYLELLDPATGKPLPGVEVRATPPK